MGLIGLTLSTCCFALTPLAGTTAEVHGALLLSDTSQASVHPAAPPLSGEGVDLSTTPRATLVFPGRHSTFSLGYGPQLLLYDVTRKDRKVLVFHLANALFTHSWRHTQLTLSETASYGTQTFTSLALLAPDTTKTTPPAGGTGTTGGPPSTMPPTPAPTGQPLTLLPQQQTLRIISETSSASIRTALNRREAVGASVAYTLFGGLDEESQLSLPLQKTASAGAFFEYLMSRRDTLTTLVSGSHTFVVPLADEYWVLVAMEVWRRQLNASLTASIGLGIAQTWTRTDQGWEMRYVPTGAANLSGAILTYRRRHFSLSLSFSLALTPVVNSVNGKIQQTLSGGTSLVMRKDRTSLIGTLGAAQTFPIDDPNSARFVAVSLVGTHSLSNLVDAFVGYTQAFQVSSSAQLSRAPQWTAFAGLSLRAPPLLF